MRRISLAAFAFIASATAAFACGTERWAVKTETDADAGSVVTAPQAARISDLIALPAPVDLNGNPNSRVAPTEMSVFILSAILTVIKREKDEDYHLVLADPPDPSMTMIVESPDPHCAEGSVFAGQIAAVRQAMDDHFGPIQRKRNPGTPVIVTAV